MRSGPGASRTILLFQIISASPSEQSRIVGSTLEVYNVGLIFVSARTNKRHHQRVQTSLARSEGRRKMRNSRREANVV